MHPRTLFTGIFLSLISAFTGIYGQSNFRPGFIIDTNNQTIQGEIKDGGDVGNSSICLFRSDETSDIREYLPGSIYGYGFTDSKYYISKHINLDDADQLVFLECLVKGSASLYYFRNKKSELYFIEKEGGQLLALTNDAKEVMVNGSKTKVYTRKYIGLLKAIFSDCFDIQSSIDNVKLTHKSLKSITCEYNECAGKGSACMIYDNSSRFRLRVGPLIGFSSNQLSLKGQGQYAAFDFSTSNDPVFGILLDLSFSRLGDKLSFQLGTEFGNNDFNAYYEEDDPIDPFTTNYYDVYMEGLSMKLFTGAKYNFTSGRVKPNLGGGLMFNKYLQSEFWYDLEINDRGTVTNEEWQGDIASDWFFGAYLQAGVDVDLSKKLILFANLKGGYCMTNPRTIVRMVDGLPDQIRIRSQLIPLSFSVGILF